MIEEIKFDTINTFDIDGVLTQDGFTVCLKPRRQDVIITGRSFEEVPETNVMLENAGVFNQVFYNPITFDLKTRTNSGEHKAKVINALKNVKYHFEDDEVQAKIIRERTNVQVIMVDSAIGKENVRRL